MEIIEGRHTARLAEQFVNYFCLSTTQRKLNYYGTSKMDHEHSRESKEVLNCRECINDFPTSDI